MATPRKNSFVYTSEVLSGLRLLKAAVPAAAEEIVRERTADHFSDLQVMMTGPGRATRAFKVKNPDVGHPNVGTDVPEEEPGPNIIGNISGRMRDELTSAVNVKSSVITGEVGFPKGIRSRPGAAAQALKWPSEEVSTTVIPVEEPRISDVGQELPVEQYIPIVLLGTKKILGRNVLRLSLFDDIMNERTKALMILKIREAIKAINPTDEVPF